jgi:hypothetical protein
VNPTVRFEDEADAEYRLAGRWYEERREHLGIEFFDAVDATIDQIVEMPQAGSLIPRVPTAVPGAEAPQVERSSSPFRSGFFRFVSPTLPNQPRDARRQAARRLHLDVSQLLGLEQR